MFPPVVCDVSDFVFYIMNQESILVIISGSSYTKEYVLELLTIMTCRFILRAVIIRAL